MKLQIAKRLQTGTTILDLVNRQIDTDSVTYLFGRHGEECAIAAAIVHHFPRRVTK